MRTKTSLLTACVLAASLFGGAATGMAQSGPAADNAKTNAAHDVTADQQSHAAADRKATQQIRKAIIADKGLSLYAHNCKIITRDGAVTLAGPVRSEEERGKVAELAGGVVGADHVTNNLSVKAN